MAKFVPLNLALVDEGQFLIDAEVNFRQAQSTMIEYAKKHGGLATGSVSVLTLKIKIKCEDGDKTEFSVKASSSMSVPTQPESVGLALADEEQDGTPALFVRNSGASKTPPAQGIITTRDGRVVNQETGEVA